MSEPPAWTFLSNHGHVLMCLAEEPDARLRDIATRVGITERSVFGIIEHLEDAGIVVRTKVGRRNRYSIDRTRPLRHEIEARRTVGDLIDLLG
jgi:DNA-binding Lrp family transcriptional regulator